MLVRRARLEDAHKIAEIHVAAWRAAYREIMPPEYLASLSVDHRETVWRENLAKPKTQMWVAEGDSGVVGWISVAASRDTDADVATGEVWAIYVDPQHWKRGIGRALWTTAEAYLRSTGYLEVTLWALQANRNAIAFYDAIGFAVDPDAEQTIECGGLLFPQIRLRQRSV